MPKAVAGTIITTVLQFDPLYEYWIKARAEQGEKEYDTPYYDDLMPPFTMVIEGLTELGQQASMAIHGVRVANTGMTMSVDDLYSEKQFSYVAEYVEPFVSRNEWVNGLKQRLSEHSQARRLSDFADMPDITEFLRNKRTAKSYPAYGHNNALES